METALTWLLTFVPITMSPGPANLLLTSSAATYGVRRTVPLYLGIVVVFALQIVVMGLGIGELVFRYPALFTVFKVVGAAFLLYLAYLFFKSGGVKQAQAEPRVGFREGALLQFFNFKALTVPLILFTQFIDARTASWGQIIALSLALYALILFSVGAWTVGGSFLKRLFQSEFGVKWQGKIFGVLLALVAIWVLVR